MEKVKKRDIKLSDYNISHKKYNELKYFCMQYEDKKRELEKSYGLKAIVNDGVPHGTTPGHPTEQAAVRNVQLQSEIELIEQTVMEADAEIYPWLMKNITMGIPYEWMDAPISRTKFYDSRRYFFYLLAQKR
ncbi:MAG: hypothetical protein J6B85_05945 [Lachnospiraceae bacterium]|nr:hypothetical protein [Lachnospiraceae bacterium]